MASEFAHRASELIVKFQRQEITPEENQELQLWIAQSEGNKRLFDELTSPNSLIRSLLLYENSKKRTWETLKSLIPELGDPIVRPLNWRYLAAACIIVFFSITYVYISEKRRLPNANEGVAKTKPIHDVRAPNGSHTILTLASGRQVALDSLQNGQIDLEGDARVSKSNGQIAYNQSGKKSTETLYNKLATSRGGEYHVVLPDGTRVWLNSASSIKYPTSFVGNERKVDVTGQVYFEIIHDFAKPFRVQAQGQIIEDMGTAFDINAYPDEPVIKTTLIEGKVKIMSSHATGPDGIVLRPGQQLQTLQQTQVKTDVIDDADLEVVTAWRNGWFVFKRARIDEIMKQISRWYDVDVEYKDHIEDLYYAKIPRSSNVSHVFAALEAAGGVHFEVSGKKIIVSK